MVRKNRISMLRKGFLGFVHMTACSAPIWTSALKVATIGLRNVDDSEELIMMQNVSGLFRHVREWVAIE